MILWIKFLNKLFSVKLGKVNPEVSIEFLSASTVHGLLGNVKIFRINIIVGINREMILTVSERDHHGVWESPTKTTGADVIVHLKEHLLGNTRHYIRVCLKNRFKFLPLYFNLFTVLFRLHLKFNVHELVYLFVWPRIG